MQRWLALSCCLAIAALGAIARADGPSDNIPTNVRRLPKLGIDVPAAERESLEAGLAKLSATIDQLKTKKEAQALLPDVLIFQKAVSDALKYQEFHDPKELAEATAQLALGQQRAEELLQGKSPWTTAKGLVVRGYISKIDGSVQPYGLVIPESHTPGSPHGYRCDVWLHGRAEQMTELNFIKDRRFNKGQFTPPQTIVLHPYGRWNNAFKFAGEIDVLEALASVKKHYHIDDDRVAIRGFSMGGAGCWQLAVHYPDRWFAANPGAGFSETPDFLKVFQQEKLEPTWWEQKLWQMYDCPEYASNVLLCPTVAYSGEIDKQKQAADIMAAALAKQGISLTHIVGPQTAHQYHPQAAADVEQRLASLAKQGRTAPAGIHFSTPTLRYNQAHWITVDGLEKHWKPAKVDATVMSDGEHTTLQIGLQNVTALTIDFPAGAWPHDIRSATVLELVTGEPAPAGGFPAFTVKPGTDRSLRFSVHKDGDIWKEGRYTAGQLRKQHGLQGPIDDAFMDSFIMVTPTGTPAHEAVGKWSQGECERAIEQWRRHFRGEARVKKDSDITDDDIKNSHLVLWGDPSSNKLLARILDKLPITWSKDKLVVSEHGEFAANQHALVAIYPNPLHPSKYVVLNSGFTFRDYAHLNNARQVPMLPDWAVVDLSTPPNAVWPGKIVAADFFDEQWQVKRTPSK